MAANETRSPPGPRGGGGGGGGGGRASPRGQRSAEGKPAVGPGELELIRLIRRHRARDREAGGKPASVLTDVAWCAAAPGGRAHARNH